MPTPDDEFSELVDATIGRVDLVDKAANGLPILLAKQADGGRAGLMAPEFVRDLIGKTTAPDPEPAAAVEAVTMTGSPAAIAKLIHEAAVRAVSHQFMKAKYDAADIKRMADNGEAMPDGSYPIADREDLANAIHAVGRGGATHDAIRRHIEARAKALGATSEIPDTWAADGSLKKDADMDETSDDLMDPTVVLAEPDEDAPGDPGTPGSPAWEAIDAATARKWTAILSRAKSALAVMSDREMIEAATADPDDAGNAMDLDDAACAIDYAISILAPFAVDELAEAITGAADMEAVGKALAGFDPAPLDVIESLTHVAKAGRSLSAANEAAIRHAVESLQKVLASLPSAPDTDSGQEVAKEATVPQIPDHTVDETAVADAPATDQVGKADAEADGKAPMRAVYDATGNLVGIVDPAQITPIAGAEAPADAAPDAAAADAGAGAGDDLAPAPAGEVGTPADGDGVAKQTDTTDTGDGVTKADATSDDVLKSSIRDLVKSVLDEHSATQTAEIAKTRDAVLELAGVVDVLKGQVKALEEQPAEPRVFANGAVPPAHLLRGQDRGAPPVDVAKARDLKRTLYTGTAPEQNEAAMQLQTAAIEELRAIHSGRAQQ